MQYLPSLYIIGPMVAFFALWWYWAVIFYSIFIFFLSKWIDLSKDFLLESETEDSDSILNALLLSHIKLIFQRILRNIVSLPSRNIARNFISNGRE